MTETVAYGIETVAGMIAIPWFVWTTVAIFNLKQEQALIKMEMGLIKKIEAWIERNGRVHD